MRMINVGILGAGMMGRQHTEALRRLPGVRVAAVADENSALAEAVGRELCIPAAYAGLDDMLRAETLDAVHICTPNHAHAAACREVLARGLGVYCEKPLALTATQAKELRDLARESGGAAGVNFNYRQNAMVREMRERVRARDWGRTLLVRGEYLQDWMLYESDYNWRCEPEIGGASRAVADIGSHWFDTVQFVTGRRIAGVYARLVTALPVRRDSGARGGTFDAQAGHGGRAVPVTTEDAALVLVEFEDGVQGALTLSQVSAGKKNALALSLDGAAYSMTWRQERADALEIGSRERGSTVILSAPEALTGDAVRYATLPAGHAVAWHDALRNGMREFYAHLRDRTLPPAFATFEDGYRAARLVDACLESHRTGRWVPLEEEPGCGGE